MYAYQKEGKNITNTVQVMHNEELMTKPFSAEDSVANGNKACGQLRRKVFCEVYVRITWIMLVKYVQVSIQGPNIRGGITNGLR